MDIKLTRHAIERAKERLNLSAKELRTHAVLSLNEGIDALADDTLRPYCMKKALKYNTSGMYLYKNGVFVFMDDMVVTVYPISWIVNCKLD